MSEFKSGIYKITINSYYIYIGQSVDIEKRWRQHLSKLKQNKHCNKKLQNIYNKHPNNIEFEILEECDESELDNKEIYWIDCYKSYNTKHGLNMNLGGDSNRKFKTREEAEVVKKKYHKRWRQTHKEHLKHQYYKNREKIREKSKKRYVDNKEKFKECRRKRGILSQSGRHKTQFEKRYNLSRSLTDGEWNIWITDKPISGNKDKKYAIKFLQFLPNITFTIPPSKNKKVYYLKKERFETRYNLSRSLTDEEWNVWTNNPKINGKSYGKDYAIKYLKILPNITFTIPPKK